MKRILSILLLVLGIICLSRLNLVDNLVHKNKSDHPDSVKTPIIPAIKAKAALIIDSDSGNIIYAQNENDLLYPASTTKVLTALVALENLDLEESITVGKEILLTAPDSSKAGLYAGQEISARELIRALMLPSGNDAAYALAIHTARQLSHNDSLGYQESLALFTDLMNRRAAAAGAKNSHFSNPDGYQDDEHYSTAYDLALIAKEAMQEPFFREVAATVDYSLPVSLGQSQGRENRPGNEPNIETVWHNTNQLLDPGSPFYYPPATGIKTGHTTAAGYCLVSSASQGDLNLVAVVLNSSENGVWTDSIDLFNAAFSNYQPASKTKSLLSTRNLRWIVALLLFYIIIKLFANIMPRAKTRKR